MPERIAWHREHEKQCACRPIPPKLRERIAHAEPSAKTKVNAKAAKTPAEGAEVDPRFAPVVEAFAKDRQVTCGKMMASVGLKVNGKIFAMMVKGRFVAKLPRERVDDLVRSGKGEYFDPRHDGRLMKEWIVLAGGTPPWIQLAKEAHRFVRSKA